MATDVERLVVQLSADFKKYQNALDRAMGVTNRRARSIETRFAAMNKRVAASFTGMVGRLGAAFAATFGAREMARLADTAIKIENSLKVTGLAGEDLAKVYDSLRDSAMRNYAPLETLATLYSRLGLAQKSLGVSVDEMLNFTDKVALALRVQGTTAQEARGALIQLSQAMGSGIVRAEEFNSIVEGAPSILRAAAAGLKEAGGEVAKLRQLVIDGKLSSQAFFRAFEAGAPILDKMVASANVTLSQALENLNNALIDSAKEFNEATGAANKFAGGINNVALAIADFDVSGFIKKIQEAGGALERFLNDVGNAEIFKDLAIGVGALDENGLQLNIRTEEARAEAASLEREVRLLQERIALNADLGIDNSEAIARLDEVSARLSTLRAQIDGMPVHEDMPGFNYGGPPRRGGRRRPKVANAVSITDFPVDPDSKKKSKAPRKTAENRFDEDLQAIRDRTAALAQEQAALRLTFYEQQKREIALQLEQQALKDVREEARRKGEKDWQNAQLAPDQIRRIDEVAAAYARQADELRKANELLDLERDVLRGALGDMKSALADGKLEWEELADVAINALDKIVDKLLDDVVDAILQVNRAGGGGGGLLGFLGSLFGGGGGTNWGALSASGRYLFDTGGYTGPGPKNKPAGVVHKGEVVWSQKDVANAGGVAAVEAMRRGMAGYANGGPVALSAPSMPRLQSAARNATAVDAPATYNIDARGAQAGVGEEIRRALEAYDKGRKARLAEDLPDLRRRGAA